MSDLISRQDAIEAMLELNTDGRVSWKDAVIDMLDALPSAEAVQGEWVEEDEYSGLWVCDQCGFASEYMDNFCPNCGTKMYKDGEDE